MIKAILRISDKLIDNRGIYTLIWTWSLLVDAEWSKRQSNKLNRYIKNAQFANPEACVEGIEYRPDRKLDRTQMLRLSTC